MSIYIYKNNQQAGPFEESKVLEWLANGQLSPDDMAVKQGDKDWKPLKVLFPNVQNKQPIVASPNFSNVNASALGAGNLQPKKGGDSKIFLFLLLGLGGLILVGAIGIVGFLFLRKSDSTVETTKFSDKNVNSNSSNSNTNSTAQNIQALKDKAKELSKLTPPLKLVSKPVLKGKIVIVEQTNTESEYSSVEIKGIHSYDEKFDDYELEKNGLTSDKLATKPDEIDTLVQILCSKGKRIGTYNTKLGSLPAYSKVCKVSIIDYRESKIIAQKSFVNRKLEPSITVSETTTEYVLLHPYEEIQKYIKGLPKQ